MSEGVDDDLFHWRSNKQTGDDALLNESALFDGLKTEDIPHLIGRLDVVRRILEDQPEIVAEFRVTLGKLGLDREIDFVVNVAPSMVKKRIHELPTAALIATQIPTNHPCTPKYERLFAWTLVAVFQLLTMTGDYSSAIRRGTRATRLVMRRSEIDLVNQLPDFKNLQESWNELTGLFEKTTHSINKNQRIEPWINLFNAYLKKRKERTRKGGKPGIRTGHVALVEFPLDDDDEEPNPRQFVIHNAVAASIGEAQLPKSERDFDQPYAKIFVKPAAVKKTEVGCRSPLMLDRQARRVASRLSVDEQMLSCDWRRMTQHEAQSVYKYCLDKISADGREKDPAWRNYLMIALMLVTGRRYDRLRRLDFRTTPVKLNPEYFLGMKSGVYLVWRAELPRNKLPLSFDEREKGLLFDNQISDALHLPLPEPIGDALRAQQQQKIEQHSLFNDDQPLQQTLSFLGGTRLQRPLTLGRLTGFLPGLLRMLGIDDVEAAWICGQSPEQTAQLYYTQLPAHRVQNLYVKALRKIDVEIPEAATRPIATPVVGSLLLPKSERVSRLFNIQYRRLIAKPRSTLMERRDFHNAIVHYTYQILCLATGHRPVTAPFERSTDFDLEAGLLYVSDKEIRSGSASRLIPLCKTAMSQTRAYISHLTELKKYAHLLDTPLATRVDQALNGQKPFLFRIDASEFQPLVPDQLEDHFSSIWPLPLNWQRHFLRSHLTAKISGELIDAILGHAAIGKEPLGPESGLSVAQVRKAAAAIEAVFTDLEITASAC